MEKQKLNINFGWMLLAVILIIAISSTISTMVCHYMQKEKNNISATNEIETTPTQNEEEGNNQEPNSTKLIMPITLNSQKHELTIECTLGEKIYKKNYPDGTNQYTQTVRVSMDGKDYKILENNTKSDMIYVKEGMPGIVNVPKVEGIKSKDGKEYIVITPNLTDTQMDETVICILDENGEIVGRIKDYGRVNLLLDERGTSKLPAYTINKDSIDISKPGKGLKGAEIRRYVIEEGKIKVEGIIKKYTEEEIRGAGVKYSDEAIESNRIYE